MSIAQGVRCLVWVVAITSFACGCGSEEQASGSIETTCERIDVSQVPALQWSACEPAPLECATLEVPVDPGQPGGDRYALDVIRLAAADPATRQGFLVVDRGGPGVRNVAFAKGDFSLIPAVLPEVHARFDVISIEGRGVSTATRADCYGDALRAEARSVDQTPDDDAEWQTAESFWKQVADECHSAHPIERIATYGTCSTVSDIELLRAAIGDESVNWLGLSYGTIVGASYASTYPERVRAFVLDAPVHPGPNSFTSTVRIPAPQFEAVLLADAELCRETSGCPFHGQSAQQILGAIQQMTADLDGQPLVVGSEMLTETAFNQAVVYSINNGAAPELWAALADGRAGDGGPLLELAKKYGGRDPDGTSRDGRWYNIVTNDFPCPAGWNVEQAKALLSELADKAPLMGRALAQRTLLCLAWQHHPDGLSIQPTSSRPALVIGGELDALTPGDWAPVMVNALGNGSHVLMHEQRTHVAFFRNSCVRDAAVGFLLDPDEPPSVTDCAAE